MVTAETSATSMTDSKISAPEDVGSLIVMLRR